MRGFAHWQTRTLLRRLASQVSRASRPDDPEAVHDLRVAIRRFSRCLRVFSQFLPRGKARRVRRRLGGVMDLAAAVRDRDIALELLREAGIPDGSPLAAALRRERQAAERKLHAAVRRLGRRSVSRKWRVWLGV
jgi:CHAD domain-containing protein